MEREAALDAWIARAQAEHGDLGADLAAFRRYAVERVEGDLDRLDQADPGELLLAFACAAGDERAMRRFEERYFGEIRVGASRLRCAPDELDEIEQHVRNALFAGGRVATMTARGDLRALIRLMALRAGISLRRKQGRAPVPDDAMLEVPDGGDSPATLVVKAEHRARFRAALEDALAALAPADRALLKLHELDGITLARLAEMQRVDRSTISRRLLRARQTVLAETRKQLARRYGVSRDEFDSFIDVIRSNFGASLQGMLGAQWD